MLRFLGRFAVFFCSKVPKMNGNAPFLSRFFRLNKGLKVGGDAPIFPAYKEGITEDRSSSSFFAL
jgi:hypothetical protein